MRDPIGTSSGLSQIRPTFADWVKSPIRATTLAWHSYVRTRARSIANVDITFAELLEARVRAKTLALGLLIVGVSLIVWHICLRIQLAEAQIHSETTSSLLTSHFGIAFTVAALAGLGYDIFAHHDKLQEQIFTLFRINHRVAEIQVDAALQKLLPNRTGDNNLHAQLRGDIGQVIKQVSVIDAAGASAGLVSLRFVSRLLRYARDAADTFEHTVKGSSRPNELLLPTTAAALADEILAAHLKAMSAGDYYKVISDFATWHDWQLRQFWHALRHAAPKVEVFRVFCFLDKTLLYQLVRPARFCDAIGSSQKHSRPKAAAARTMWASAGRAMPLTSVSLDMHAPTMPQGITMRPLIATMQRQLSCPTGQADLQVSRSRACPILWSSTKYGRRRSSAEKITGKRTRSPISMRR